MRRCSVEQCDKPHVCKGLCQKHYTRLRRHGDVTTRLPNARPRPVADVLKDYVPELPANECWEWQGHVDANGYGVLNRGGKTHRAHRFVYEALVGPIPAGLLLMHSCDNPPCVNPNHLSPGTNADNVADCVQKERNNRGEEMWSAKLAEQQVLEAREKFATGRYGITQLARSYGITDGPMWELLHGITWKYLPLAAPRPGGPARGSKSPASKLTEEIVAEIREKFATGNHSQADLAREYGLTATPMSQLIRGVTWKHVHFPKKEVTA